MRILQELGSNLGVESSKGWNKIISEALNYCKLKLCHKDKWLIIIKSIVLTEFQ